MRSGPQELQERFFRFAVAVLKHAGTLPKTGAGRHVSEQMLRSGTSAAANYEEGCAAESRADFVHKLLIVLKELRECRFWIRLANHSGLVPDARSEGLQREAEELGKIIGKSDVTAKKNRTNRPA